MVLVRTLIWLALAGCVKTGSPVQAPSSVDVATTITLGTLDQPHGEALPSELARRLTAVLSARRLNLRPVDAPSDFLKRRETAHRLAWLAANNESAPLLVLMELNARRYGNLGGRFRWVVGVKLSITHESNPAGAQTITFSVPVHLGHAHSDATDATRASIPTIERRLAAALDSYLAGSGTP